MNTLQKMIMWCEDTEASANYAIKKFKDNFEKDPSYAFEWSQDTFAAAGRLKVAMTIRGWAVMIKEEDTPESRTTLILKEVRRTVINKAKWPDHSTSTPSNEMSLCVNAAYAEFLDKFTVLT